MSTITVLHINSPLLEQFTQAFGSEGTRYGVAHTVYSHAAQEVDPELVSISLRAGTDEAGNPLPGASFDPETYEPQELSAQEFLALVASDPVNFPPAEPEPVVPRYKTKLTASEFSRDLLTAEEWGAIELVASANPAVGAWRDITLSGNVWMEHPDFIAGMAMAVSLGIFTEERATDVRQGLLIK